jgi:CO/xanthine dehydrogenase Mo-binding subunit
MTQGSPIGRSVRRLDGGEKVTGLTRFAGDVRLPNRRLPRCRASSGSSRQLTSAW